MSAEASSITRSWRVGRYTATLTVPRTKPGHLASAVIDWTPHVPQRLTDDELATYRRGRNAAVASLSPRCRERVGERAGPLTDAGRAGDSRRMQSPILSPARG